MYITNFVTRFSMLLINHCIYNIYAYVRYQYILLYNLDNSLWDSVLVL